MCLWPKDQTNVALRSILLLLWPEILPAIGHALLSDRTSLQNQDNERFSLTESNSYSIKLYLNDKLHIDDISLTITLNNSEQG